MPPQMSLRQCPGDYQALSGTLTFPHGELSKTLTFDPRTVTLKVWEPNEFHSYPEQW
ncbi:hypothetical protein [endosymbiont of Lamellibrachia barhami]|uniref:hypothetical protein n=1 Tax=endosymbiont of Lamellibrachia barhami TaxID=205975 RepID=UPI0015B0C8E6|nr:hypothetical protein [endosymbiont of Lamellibrachia barhami]